MLPASHRPVPCDDCNSHRGSRTGKRARDLAGRGMAGRSPLPGLASGRHLHPAVPALQCYHRTEPEPHIGSHHN